MKHKRTMYLITIVLILVTVEFLSFAALQTKRELEEKSRNYTENLNAYYKNTPDQKLLNDYIASVAQVYAIENLQYDPYRGYEPLGNFKSISINTDSEGFRFTNNPPNLKNLPTKHVAMFGGPIQWGIGTIKDSDTISSLLSNLLNSNPQNVFYYEVKKFGVGGYGFSQEFLTFIERLGSEPIDAAVFLDGVNEIEHSRRETSDGKVGEGFFIAPEWLSQAVASQSSNSQNEEQQIEFHTLHALRWAKAELQVLLNTRSNNIRTLEQPTADNLNLIAKENEDLERRQSRRIWNHYERRMDTLDALSKKFNFVNLHFLQPHLGTKSRQSIREKQIYAAYFKSERLPSIMYLEGKRLANRHENFFDISDCFDGIGDELYIDDHHTGRNGNLLIAKCIFDDIELILRWQQISIYLTQALKFSERLTK